VTDAALFLFTRSLNNWARQVFTQLRSPRYALAILFGVLYLGLLFLGQHQDSHARLPVSAVSFGGTLLLLVLVGKWWVFGADRLALAFSPAEIQFLFPAPVTRTALLLYKLVRAQRLILLNVLVWALLLRRREGSGLALGPYAVTMWVFFSTVMLHRLGVALTRATITEHGWSGVRRAWGAILFLVVLASAAWISLLRRMPPTGLGPLAPESPLETLRQAVETPPLSLVLWPFRVPLLPLEAPSLGLWLRRLGPALALLGLHLWWVLRADRRFEEAAIEASARRAELLRRWRRREQKPAGARRALRFMSLRPQGHPIGAVVWRNLTRLLRTVSTSLLATLLGVLAIGIGFFVFAAPEHAVLTSLGSLALSWVGILAILGPLWIRIDLRADMDRLDTLRSWPLSGLALVSGEVLSSAVVLVLLEALLASAGAIALREAGLARMPLPLLVAGLLAGLLVLSGLNLIALCIQNGAALLFPSWVRTEIQPGGIEQIGQQLLTAGVSVLLLLLFAVGPGLLGGLVAYLLRPSIREWSFVAGGLVGAVGLGIEAFLCLDWLGSRFEHTDPSKA